MRVPAQFGSPGCFPIPGNILRPGGYAKVRAVIRLQHDALLVPQRAVSELQGGYQVAVVGGDNKVSIRTVTVGDRVGSRVGDCRWTESRRTSRRRRGTESANRGAGEPQAVWAR